MELPISQLVFRERAELALSLKRATQACDDANRRFRKILGQFDRFIRANVTLAAQFNLRREEDVKLHGMGRIRANKSDADAGRL